MPQPERQPSHEHDGPFVNAALFCMDVHHAPDGRVTIDGVHEGTLASGRPGRWVTIRLVLVLTGGLRYGPVRITVMATAPGRNPVDMGVNPSVLVFDGPGYGQAIEDEIRVPTDVEGMVMVDVFADGRLLTRIPYGVEHRVGFDDSLPPAHR